MPRLAGLVALGIFAALIAVPSPGSSVSIANTDILVFLVGQDSVSLPLGAQATFTWIAYNNGTSPHLLVAHPPANGVLSFVASPVETVLQPGASDEIHLEVHSPRYSETRSFPVSMTFEATRLATGSVGTASFSLLIDVLGVTAGNNPQGKVLGVFPNLLPAPLNNEWGAFGISAAFWLLVGGTIYYVVAPVLKRLASKTKTRIDDIVLEIAGAPAFVLIAIFGAVNSLKILGLPPDWTDLLGRAYGFGFVIIVTWVGYRVFRRALWAYGGAGRTEPGVDHRIVPVLDKLGAVLIVLAGIVFAVQSLGYDLTLFLAGLGVVGLIIAFAAQDTLSNFFSGLYLMLDRPFRTGDLIQLDTGEVCEVRDIGMRSTKLYWGKDNVVLIIPNNKIAGTKVVNFDRPDRPFKVHFVVGVSYDSDLDRVKALLREIADAHTEILRDPGHDIVVQVDDLAESAILVRLIFWVPTSRDQWRVAAQVRESVLRRFRAEGIEIPFPQRVVWNRASSVPAGLSSSRRDGGA
ncbi:MAG TPA: mechanosensitive ion channel family protein [Thermoplasmata archaeon]|jgi:small-conductance mechanosensitive channel|nr:mechanosensitive ion channel family protein [Thermoplasmata archaeon]